MALPTTTIAGISVPDTSLVKAAITRAKTVSPVWLFNHAMRSWLFAIKLAEFENITMDQETLAVAAILHDVGLMLEHSTPDRRFEVDGAASAVEFLKEHIEEEGSQPQSADYFKNRLRELTVWDAIATHTTPSIACHSIPEVRICQQGIGIDFVGHGMEHIPDAAAIAEAIFKAYPRLEMRDGFRECLCALVRKKPQTTYDNWVGAVGKAYVEGYEWSRKEEEMYVALLSPN